MHPTLNIAVRAARNAGNIIIRHMSRIDNLNITKKGRNDFVSEVDYLAEQEIINTIHNAFPGHQFLAEESGSSQPQNTGKALDQAQSDFCWIIDPLDGTTNFLHSFPQFAVSIALQYQGKIEQAVIYDPLRDELFTATIGRGAFLNDKRIRVSGQKVMNNALLGTGFPFKQPELIDYYLTLFKSFHLQASGIRRAGAAALDLAYIAAGRLDGFWELGLKPWDMAAGLLIIQEAGGLNCDFNGEQNMIKTGNIISGTPKIFSMMVKQVMATPFAVKSPA